MSYLDVLEKNDDKELVLKVGNMYRAKLSFSTWRESDGGGNLAAKGDNLLLTQIIEQPNMSFGSQRVKALQFLHGMSLGWVRFSVSPDTYIEDWTDVDQ